MADGPDLRRSDELTHKVFVPQERLVGVSADTLRRVRTWLKDRNDVWSYDDFQRNGKVYGTNDPETAAVLAAVAEHGMVAGRSAIDLIDARHEE